MKSIFVIEGSCGTWEDTFYWNVFAYLTKEEAERDLHIIQSDYSAFMTWYNDMMSKHPNGYIDRKGLDEEEKLIETKATEMLTLDVLHSYPDDIQLYSIREIKLKEN